MPPANLATKPAPFLKNLLWIDCTGAAVAGVVVIIFSGWLSQLEGLPQELLIFTGAVNVLYASYSFSLALRPKRPMGRIKLLVAVNLAWAPVCVGLLIAFSATATLFAYLHLVGEAVYVAGLAALEWRYRELLRTA
jgi:hypothetical protein